VNTGFPVNTDGKFKLTVSRGKVLIECDDKLLIMRRIMDINASFGTAETIQIEEQALPAMIFNDIGRTEINLKSRQSRTIRCTVPRNDEGIDIELLVMIDLAGIIVEENAKIHRPVKRRTNRIGRIEGGRREQVTGLHFLYSADPEITILLPILFDCDIVTIAENAC